MQPCLHLLAEYCIHFVDKEGEGDKKSQHFMDVIYGSPLKEYVWRDGVGTWKLGPEAIYRALDLRRVGSFVAHAAAAAAGLRSSGLGSDAAAVADLICGP